MSTVSLKAANKLFRDEKYEQAAKMYATLANELPFMRDIIDSNYKMAIRKFSISTGKEIDRATNRDTASLSSVAHLQSKPVAVVAHYYYPEIWTDIENRLRSINYPYKLFVTVPTEILSKARESINKHFPDAHIFHGPNLGMDIVPFLNAIKKLHQLGYEVVCKLQTKRGVDDLASTWRDVMLDSLIGSNKVFEDCANAFLNNSNLAVIGPASLYQSGPRLMMDNKQNLEKILQNKFQCVLPESNWGFFAGTMFWARLSSIIKIADVIDFQSQELTREYKQDGKIEHALERLFGLVAKINNQQIGLLHPTAIDFKNCVLQIVSADYIVCPAGVGTQMRSIRAFAQTIELIQKSNLFDERIYAEYFPEMLYLKFSPIMHYATIGQFRGVIPVRDKSTFKLVSDNLKLTSASEFPFITYTKVKMGVDKSINLATLIPVEKATKYNIDVIKKSGLFDESYYISQFETKPSSNIDLIQHYFETGSYDDLHPNKWFIPREYRKLNPDTVKAGFDPLYHYFIYGAKENRKYRENINRQEKESPFYRYLNLNSLLIDWDAHCGKIFSGNLVSIIIPIFDQPELTEKCIESIYGAINKCIYEVICVDNGSQVETQRLLDSFEKAKSNLTVVRNKENMNFSVGCNLGFNQAKGARIVFLNNDTTVSDYWLDDLIEPLENPAVAAVQPKLLYPDGTVQNIGIVFGMTSPFGYPIYEGFPGSSSVANLERRCKAVTAACIALRSSDFAKLRGFDPLFINGQEDVDLCLRLIGDTGRHCLVQPKSVVTHHESKSKGRGKFIPLNRANFKNRWKDYIEFDDVEEYRKDGFYISFYTRDSDEMEAAGLAIRRPVILEKNAADYNGSSEGMSRMYPSRLYEIDEYDEFASKVPVVLKAEIPISRDKHSVVLVAHSSSKELFGSERSFLDMLNAVASLGFNVTVVLPECSSFSYLKLIAKSCSRIFIGSYKHWRSEDKPRVDVISFFKYIYYIQQADYIYVNTIMMKEASIAANDIGIPVLTHVRELISSDVPLQTHIGLSSEEIIEDVYLRSSAVVCNSDATVSMFSRSAKVILARNVVDVDLFSKVDLPKTDFIRFGLVSSNIEKKGVKDFFDLATRCASSVPLAKFYLIGPITELVESIMAQDRVKELRNIEVVGYVESNVKALAMVDVVLSLSHFDESFGRTVAEGFACSRPVIAYERGAIPELVEHGVCGRLVTPGDIDGLFASVKLFVDSPSLIKSYGANGRNKVISLCSPNRLKQDLSRAFVISKLEFLTKEFSHSDALLAKFLRHAEAVNHQLFIKGLDKSVSVVIPVFNAYEQVVELFNSVKDVLHGVEAQFIVINDASTDSRIDEYFLSQKNDFEFSYHRNETNLGYTATVNKGILLAEDNDIVLLNSDTIVTPAWLLGLKMSAFLNANVGTVTAMSDNAGVFSFPEPGVKNPLILGTDRNMHASKVIQLASTHEDIVLPTGNGFCMYIRRDLINIIGCFDLENFPRGYGEENDFCMRAGIAGFSNLLCTSSFVYHSKSSSFKGERELLIEAGAKALSKLHPDYPKLVSTAFGGEKIKSLRNSIRNLYM